MPTTLLRMQHGPVVHSGMGTTSPVTLPLNHGRLLFRRPPPRTPSGRLQHVIRCAAHHSVPCPKPLQGLLLLPQAGAAMDDAFPAPFYQIIEVLRDSFEFVRIKKRSLAMIRRSGGGSRSGGALIWTLISSHSHGFELVPGREGRMARSDERELAHGFGCRPWTTLIPSPCSCFHLGRRVEACSGLSSLHGWREGKGRDLVEVRRNTLQRRDKK